MTEFSADGARLKTSDISQLITLGRLVFPVHPKKTPCKLPHVENPI